ENARDIVYRYEISPNRGFSYVSPAIERVLGISLGQPQTVGAQIQALLYPEDLAKILTILTDPAAMQRPIVLRSRHVDGHTVWLEHVMSLVTDRTGTVKVVEGFARDITERVEAEQQKLELERKLQETQRLEAIGVLAGGIAHDFNNILVSV